MSDLLAKLAPASVWVRKDGSLNTVLFISNETLTEKVQAKFPPQVVYVDDSANIFTRSVEDFLTDRIFYNLNGELESRLEALFQLDEDSLGEADLLLEDDDVLQVEDSGESAETPEWQEEVLAGLDTEETPVAYVLPVSYSTSNTADVPFSLERLSELTASYTQEPSVADKTIYHKLYIQATAGLTKDILHSLFTVNGGFTLIPTVTAPAYSNTSLEIDWDTFLGIYVQVYEDVTYFIVVLGTPLVAETVASSESSVVEEVAYLAPPEEVTSTEASPPTEIVKDVSYYLKDQAYAAANTDNR